MIDKRTYIRMESGCVKNESLFHFPTMRKKNIYLLPGMHRNYAHQEC